MTDKQFPMKMLVLENADGDGFDLTIEICNLPSHSHARQFVEFIRETIEKADPQATFNLMN